MSNHFKSCFLAWLAALLQWGSVFAEPLPQTKPLEPHADRSAEMRAGFRRYLLRELSASISARAKGWRRDVTSPEAYQKSIAPNRERLRRMIGAVDKRLPVLDVELVATTRQSAIVAETSKYVVQRIRWPVLPGVTGEGLLLEPKSPPSACFIALPDADQTPEQIAGLAPGVEPPQQFARRLAESGCRVVVPLLVNRESTWSGHPDVAMTNQPHREWIYRQAFEMGRHIIGYEVQRVLAIVDWLSLSEPQRPIGIAGYSEGGLIALHAAALDVRIKACLVSGYFQPRQQVWEEPIYRNLFGLLAEFGDAEIASLIAPRTLIVEHSAIARITGLPAAVPGRRNVAAPGELVTPAYKSVHAEVDRCRGFFPVGGVVKPEMTLIAAPAGATVGPGSDRALAALMHALGVTPAGNAKADQRDGTVPNEALVRQRRQVQELVEHTQRLLRYSPQVRAKFWSKAQPAGDLDAWRRQTESYRDYLHDELVGRLPESTVAANPRSRVVIDDRPRWIGYEVVLDVYPDVFCWGTLLVPKDLKPGERRPVVVCQHGLEGVPADVIEEDRESAAWRVYKGFAAALADRGFVVYAPHNFYRGGNEFRMLQRMAHPLKKTMFGLTTAQPARHLEWLSSLPFVDGKRIGFYGLSYGGNTAMRVPAILEQYACVICSGDFNEWIYKNTTTDALPSMIYHNVWEVFEWNLGHTFNHSDLAGLIAPRPFMVERGHDDGVAIDEWIAAEYACVRRLYAKLGIPGRTEIEFFNGPHAIHGEGTYRFLHRHLKWPMP